MTRSSAPWLRLGRLADLPSPAVVRVRVDHHELALCRRGDELHLVDGTCPHQAGPLAEGTVAGATLRCPLHGWLYDLHTGARVDRPGAPIATHDVRTSGGWVEARLHDTGVGR
jgi:nitrite reductase/ring-hydroxylating ferredoxin subunit